MPIRGSARKITDTSEKGLAQINQNFEQIYREAKEKEDNFSLIRVYQGQADTIATSTTTKLNLNIKDFDVQNEWDTSQAQFKAKQAGYYRIDLQMTLFDHTSGSTIIIMLYKNGQEEARNQLSTGAISDSSPKISVVVKLSVGDRLEAYANQNTGGTKTVLQARNKTFMCIERIR